MSIDHFAFGVFIVLSIGGLLACTSIHKGWRASIRPRPPLPPPPPPPEPSEAEL